MRSGRWTVISTTSPGPEVCSRRANASTTLVPVTGFVSLDARIAYNETNWLTWSVAGQNLTHASQIQTGGPAVERRVLGSMTFNLLSCDHEPVLADHDDRVPEQGARCRSTAT